MSRITVIAGSHPDREVEEWYSVKERLPRLGQVVFVRGTVVRHSTWEDCDEGTEDVIPNRIRFCQYLGKGALMTWQVIGPYYIAWVEGVVRWKPVLDQFGSPISFTEDYPVPSKEEQRRILEKRYKKQIDAINQMSVNEFNKFWLENKDKELEKRWKQHKRY